MPSATCSAQHPVRCKRTRPDQARAAVTLHAAASIGVAKADSHPRTALNDNVDFQALKLSKAAG